MKELSKALLAPPDPLLRGQRICLWITFLFVAATRVFALSRTMWDWDEVQFASGVREFQVGGGFHHPHPPGFPLYILAAKLLRPFADSDFHALQSIVFVCACALFPLAFFLARELRFSFATAYSGALLFVFLPNMWFFGGTAFSDIVGVATSLAAAMLLLRGARGPRAYLGGALMLGIAAGVRPQAMLFGFAPFLVASWFQLRRSWVRVIAAGAIIVAVVAASYLGAALSSVSLTSYRDAITAHRGWITNVDSFRNPNRPPLLELTEKFFVQVAARGWRLPFVVTGLALLGLLAGLFRSRLSVWLAFATFAPFALFAWLTLDHFSYQRFSTGYVYLWAILAAHGMGVLLAPLGRFRNVVQVAAMVALIARVAWWTIPVLQEMRETISPPYAAMQWIRRNVSPRRPIWVDGSMGPYAEYFLDHRDARMVTKLTQLPRTNVGPRDFYVTEGQVPNAQVTFIRPRGRVWELVHHLYFDASIVPLSRVWGFGNGWYGLESDGPHFWQWMGPRSEALLPAMPGRARLSLTLAAAGELTPDVEVQFNGAVLDRFRATGTPVTHEWVVESRGDAPNRLVITASQTMKAPPDTRDLSLQITSYSLQPVR